MRPIKFRAWDATEKKMWFPCAIRCGDDPVGIFEQFGILGADRQHDVLMQFTGLHDKSGREIYEGDILRSYHGEPCPVVWNEDISGFFSGAGSFIIQPADWREREVVGNIHENPELLKP